MTEELTMEAGAEAGEGNFKVYIIGYVLAILLTAISFACVLSGLVPPEFMMTGLVAAAIVQVYVHLNCFLHMNSKATPRWNIIVFGFAAIVIFIVIGGSIWIMGTAGNQMMPASMTDMANMP